MSYPIYDIEDVQFAERDGDYPVSDFADFISQLVEGMHFDTPTEQGILALVNTKGTKVLSENQGKVLNLVVARYDNETCSVCGEKIPLHEVLYNSTLCSYHAHQATKDDD